jgi:hypothetical protein
MATSFTAGGASAPIVMIHDADCDDSHVYLAEGPAGLPLSDAVDRVDAAIRAAKTAPADPETGYTFEDLEREIEARGMRMVPSYAAASERW